MANPDIHKQKYLMFKRDAEDTDNSIPTRIEAYFNASFHLIELKASKYGIHIDKHQSVRVILEKNNQIFKSNTERLWRVFQEIENQIRPGQIYGGTINGKKLKRIIELFKIIEAICGEIP